MFEAIAIKKALTQGERFPIYVETQGAAPQLLKINR
jgi:hypothetical protein